MISRNQIKKLRNRKVDLLITFKDHTKTYNSVRLIEVSSRGDIKIESCFGTEVIPGRKIRNSEILEATK